MHQKEIKDNKEKDVKIDNKGIYLILILENNCKQILRIAIR